MKKTCIIIPVHKKCLNDFELISLKACKRILYKYDTFLIYPSNLRIVNYIEIYDNLIPLPVDPEWMSSIENYNKMKINLDFYRLFSGYEYLVTYELDSYVFKDIFSLFQDYDFIGAPFFEGYLESNNFSKFIDGCNSGFSMRNIPRCIEILYSIKNSYNWVLLLNKFFNVVFRKKKLYLLLNLPKKFIHLFDGSIENLKGINIQNEDLFWSQIVPKFYTNFKVAKPLVALKFSFESQPERLFILNDSQLPLGCHGWNKNILFWSRHIELNNKN